MTKISLRALVVLATGFVLVNCANKSTNNFANTLAGKFTDRFTTLYDISDKAWSVTYPGIGACVRTVIASDNKAGNVSYTEGMANCFNPSKYGKTFYVSDGSGSFWVCDYLTGKSTVNEITQSGQPDSTSPASGGCNGKAWSKFTPTDSSFSLVGNFTDNYGGSQVFTNTLWTSSYGTPCSYAVIFYDNVNGFFIYQQQADAGCTSANNYKFGKVFWTVDSASKLYYCELMYGQSSYLTVANSTTKPGYSNPATTGCSGFGWTQLIR